MDKSESDQQEDQEQQQEEPEQQLRDGRCRRRYAAETKRAGDDGYDQEDKGEI